MQNSLTMCTDTAPTLFGLFDPSIAPALLFYSYIPIALAAVIMGGIIFVKARRLLTAQLFFALSVLFAVSILNEIFLWISIPAALVYFGWALVPLLRLLITLTTIAFVYAYVYKKPLPFVGTALLGIASLPVLLLLPTSINIVAFDLDFCEAISGPLISYVYLLSGCAVLWITYSAVKSYRELQKTSANDKTTVILTVASGLFLLLLSFSEFIAVQTGEYTINLIGPIGMLVFLIMLSYTIVKFKIYRITVVAPVAFILSLWVLIGSLIFLSQSPLTRLVTGCTLVIAVGLGLILIRSIRRTVQQKEQIEKLVIKLEDANTKLKELDKMKSEFVSIASHQLRSPLTSIRGYASMLLEGSYGKLPQKAQEAIERIADSSRFMASSVEDYLNVSRIQAGNMKYEYSDFNLKDLAQEVADDTRGIAMKKGLLLLFKADLTKRGIVHADVGKTRQVIDNLVNNALKYTPKGTITILVRDNPKQKKIFVDVIDSGIGMKPHMIDRLFEKFERAENANAVNVTGTGLGLYIARRIAQEMKGDVTASSEGEGKGSTFTLQLPLQL